MTEYIAVRMRSPNGRCDLACRATCWTGKYVRPFGMHELQGFCRGNREAGVVPSLTEHRTVRTVIWSSRLGHKAMLSS